MKLSRIEMEGFRGVRAHQKINVPNGFLVITGRNGSGKSTVCDAIEYALTGTLSKYEESTERGESTEQYVWWRGRRPAANNYVRVVLRAETGHEVVVERRPDGVTVGGSDSLEASLCDVGIIRRDPLAQLCRTSIIRDESIAALSVDLPEADRFTFVRAALGTDSLDEVTDRGKSVQQTLKKQVAAAANAYSKTRDEVTALLAQLSQARASVDELPDVGRAEEVIRQFLGREPLETVRLLPLARRELARMRQRNEVLVRLARELDAAQQALGETDSDEAAKVDYELLERRHGLLERGLQISDEVAQMQLSLGREAIERPRKARLASLYEAGRYLGLRHDGCPLCGTSMPEDVYAKALDRLAEQIAATERAEAELRDKLADTIARQAAIESEIAVIDAERRRRAARIVEARESIAAIVDEVRRTLPVLQSNLSAGALLEEVSGSQARLEELGNAIATLEASAALELVADLERRVAEAREKSEALEAHLRRSEAAEARAKRMLAGIRRGVGEIVEEKLAALDPLLKDLYGRLRPHNDWTDLSFSVRGDLRKFLSLRVGEDINPRFTFSSGQRRAIGLAFLLAVHLSRPWCRLQCLVLDDPVQHIDDFRSLHLVEVLSAIRKAGQQIVCAVEDEGLAELMCRRLRQGVEGDGYLVRMGYQAGEGARIESADPVAGATRALVLTA
jgi:chromosome segregation protein